jgi:hypothetical protein
MAGVALLSPCATAIVVSARRGSARMSDLRRRIREVLIVIIGVYLLSLVFRQRLALGMARDSVSDLIGRVRGA